MKGYAMLKIGESGWIEKERPKCGPMDAICRPLAVAICTSDVHTLWEGAIGDRHNMILGHECCAEVVEVGELVKISNRETGFLCRPSSGLEFSGSTGWLFHALRRNAGRLEILQLQRWCLF